MSQWPQKICAGPRCLWMPGSKVGLHMGRNSSIYDYKAVQRASAIRQHNPEYRSIQHRISHICLGQRWAQSHLLWYYVQPTINCQPSYCWGIWKIEPHKPKESRISTLCFGGLGISSQAPAQVYVRQRRFASGNINTFHMSVFDGDQF